MLRRDFPGIPPHRVQEELGSGRSVVISPIIPPTTVTQLAPAPTTTRIDPVGPLLLNHPRLSGRYAVLK